MKSLLQFQFQLTIFLLTECQFGRVRSENLKSKKFETQDKNNNLYDAQGVLNPQLKILERNLRDDQMDSTSTSNSSSFESWDQHHKVHAVTQTLNKLIENYDKRVRPYFYGPPVNVGVTVFVKNLASVSEVDMEFQVDIYFRQYWKDPRLLFNLTRPGTDRESQVQVIGLTLDFAKEIWQPDTYFPNEKMSYIHAATVENQFFRLFSNGQVLKSTRLTLVSSCVMSLSNFPLDYQICSIQFGSYGYSTSDLKYSWQEGSVSVKVADESLNLPQFEVKGHRQRMRTSETSTGNYSVLYCEFLLERYLNYYLTQVYVPAALIVVISWFSQWMERDAAERTALGVTSVLTITTLLMSTNSNSPKISYIKALDIYLAVCFASVFASLLQSATIGYLFTRIKSTYNEQKRLISNNPNSSVEYGPSILDPQSPNQFQRESCTDKNNYCCCSNSKPTFQNCFKCQREGETNLSRNVVGTIRIAKMDILARFIFPFSFTTFNVIYWTYYLNIKRLDDKDWHLNTWGGA